MTAANKNLQPVITELHKAFDLLNKHFYDNKLTPVVIAIQAKGKSNAYGWYTPYPSWAEGDETKQEITITAEHLDRPYLEIMRTLHHEMIHHYCHLNDIAETSRQGKYHNKKFKEESEKRGFHYPDGKPDAKIGWSYSKLTEETEELFNGWPLDKTVFGLARIDMSKGTEKKKKTSNIIKWVCPSCGATMRSSKFLGIKPYCMNDKEADGTDKDVCAAFFEPEIPEGFNGKLSWDDEEETDVDVEAEEVAEVIEPVKEVAAPPVKDTKPREQSEYSNMPRRFNKKICPTCPWFTGDSCRKHVSTIEFANKVVEMYEVRPLDLDNPYEKMPECTHKEMIPKTVMKLDEFREVQ
ncbi:hypothetical protein [Peribacillus muralis]|uniref:hypothetical protein n=1 Tax=Peribacillus muralis TaxID=264697 RepID=UPI00366FAD0F